MGYGATRLNLIKSFPKRREARLLGKLFSQHQQVWNPLDWVLVWGSLQIRNGSNRRTQR